MVSISDSLNKGKDNKNLFIGDSQMATLMRNYNWESHPLGDPDSWPVSLKTGIRILLHSAHPMFIWWSEEMYNFYNDGYTPLIGKKHPDALGAKGYEVWAEIWPQLGAVIESILEGEKAFYGEELLVPINRKGFLEDAYFTFSYSAMFNDEGEVSGIFCACHEATETVLAKRRLKIIKDLPNSLNGLFEIEQACQAACELIKGNPQDIPFALIYMLNKSESEAMLMGQTNDFPRELAPLQQSLSKAKSSAIWPFAKVQCNGQPEIINLNKQGFLSDTSGPQSSPQAVVFPIFQPGLARHELAIQENSVKEHSSPNSNHLLGFFIFGLNPKLEYDTNYQNFHQLLAGQLATSIAEIKSRAEINKQKARLERFFMQVPAAICILNGPDFIYELVNPSYLQLFPGLELLGKPLLEAIPGAIDSPAYHTLREVYETGKTHEEKEILIPMTRSKDGILEDRYFNYIQQARHDEEGNIDGVVVFTYEVTDLVLSRRRVEASERMLKATSDQLAVTNEELAAANEEVLASNEELSSTNQQLLRINSDMDNFIYTASHDLKAPINNIEGLLKVLLMSFPPELQKGERIQKITGMMQSSINRFKKTIANLTEITKLQKENNQQSILNNIAEVVNEVILDLEPMIQSTRARIEMEAMDCLSINFSPKNLRSVVYNLLSNALKYHSPERNPLVQISCHQTDEYLVLLVKDNGLGMNLSSDKSKIFTMFKRLHSHVEGDGLGLYMVKKIIDNAGGKIEVESTVGEGSTFQVYFKR